MSIPEKVTVTATVKSAEVPAEGDKDYKAALEIPAFKSKYPTTVYIPVDVTLRKGQTVSVSLKQGKLAKEDYDGTAYWHFQWRWDGLSTHAEPQAAPSAQEPRHEAPGAPDRYLGADHAPFRSPAQIIRGEAFGLALRRLEIELVASKTEEPMPLTMLAQDALYVAYVIERGKLPPREPNYQKPPRTPEPQEEEEAPQ